MTCDIGPKFVVALALALGPLN